MLYLIAYDLNMEGQNYRAVTQAIASLAESEDDCCRIQQSVWIVRSNKLSENAVLERLRPAMDNNDHCFITKLSRYSEWMMEPETESQIRRMLKRDDVSKATPFVF